MIPLARPAFDAAALDAALEVLRSGMLVMGEAVARFEALLADACGRRAAVVVTSGTTALELALEVCGVGPGDEVLVPGLSWPSPAHAVCRRGATPVLIDVDPGDWNGAPEAFAAARSSRTRAAIVIDQFGAPARKDALRSALEGLRVVEDAACAIGSRFADGAPCGSFGDVSCLSFHPRKVITTGEGGACLTDDEALLHRMRALRNHGQEAPGRFVMPGPNLRPMEIVGALGVAEMARLPAYIARRRALHRQMTGGLEALGLTLQEAAGAPNHQTLGVLLPDAARGDALERAAEHVCERMRARGVQAGRLSYRLDALGTLPAPPLPLVHAGRIAQGIALPLHPQMSDDDAKRVVRAMGAAL